MTEHTTLATQQASDELAEAGGGLMVAIIQLAVMLGAIVGGTLFDRVQSDMKIYKEEIFGPVVSVTTFKDEAEALAIANDTEYGLSAAIISKDVGRALNLGERLRTGLLHINDQTVNDEVINPFGGVGASGNGTSIGGAANGEEFTQWQWLTLKGEAPAYPL